MLEIWTHSTHFILGQNKRKKKNKSTLPASYKHTWRTDVPFVFPVLVCLGDQKSKGINKRGTRKPHEVLPRYKIYKKILKSTGNIDNHKKY